MLQTAKSIVKNDGIKGLYRGCVPPLWVGTDYEKNHILKIIINLKFQGQWNLSFSSIFSF
jgi:hypothetical protein